ncbi:hypothetical protein D6D00_09989 [Aureobasidium pullulans]|nr:hypothetical protein D6D00_09989 [Aureobasidium pullulans]
MATTPSSLDDLSNSLASNVSILTTYLDSVSYPAPPFDQSGPDVTLPKQAPQHVKIARQQLMDQALQIFQLAAGPSEFLANLQPGYHNIAVLQWLCHFNIFRLVPEGGISYSELAQAAGVSEDKLKGVARMAMTTRVFCEPSPGHIMHTSTSKLLATNPNHHDWAVFMCDLSAPTAASMVDAHQAWPNSDKKNQTAYNVAFQHDQPYFDHLKQQPERHKQFAGYMQAVTTSEGTDLVHLINGFDWGSLGKARIVDIGGSSGHASAALAKRYPQLHLTVQDLPEVIVSSGAKAISTDADLSSRITFEPHSFFEEQTIHGADIYLLRMILHDWGFEDSVKILSNIVPSLGANSKIIIMDTVLPEPGSIPSSVERLLRVRDLTMMQVFNSQERAVEDWGKVFEKADPRLRVLELNRPFGSNLALIVLGLDG